MRLADKVATMARRGAQLPYDAEVEWLLLPKGSYINLTSFLTLSNSFDFVISAKRFDNNSKYFFSSSSSSVSVRAVSYGKTGDSLVTIWGTTLSFVFTGYNVDEFHEFKNTHDGKAYVDGTFFGEGIISTPKTVSRIYIGGFNLATREKFYFKSLKVIDGGGVTKMDVIPVRIGDVGYVYDKINGWVVTDEANVITPGNDKAAGALSTEGGGGTKCLTRRRDPARFLRPSARFCAHSQEWEVAA